MCCEIIYNKNYTNATKSCTIINVPEIYNPDAFADWLTSAFNESSFKSFEELAQRAKTTRSTISRYAGAKKQSLTNKPSQPKSGLVIALAEALNKDVNEALMAAGHAPKTAVLPPELADIPFSRLDKSALAYVRQFSLFLLNQPSEQAKKTPGEPRTDAPAVLVPHKTKFEQIPHRGNANAAITGEKPKKKAS